MMQRPVINIGQLIAGSFLSRMSYQKDGTFVTNVSPGSATQSWHETSLSAFIIVLSFSVQHRGRPDVLHCRQQT